MGGRGSSSQRIPLQPGYVRAVEIAKKQVRAEKERKRKVCTNKRIRKRKK